MFVEIEQVYKRFKGIPYKRIKRIKKPLDMGESVTLEEGMDSASSDDFSNCARVQTEDPRFVQLVHQFGHSVVLGDLLEANKVNSDSRTKGHLRWIDEV